MADRPRLRRRRDPAAALGSLLTQRVAQPVLLLSFAALTVLAAAAMIVDSRSSATSGPDDDDASDGTRSAQTPRGGVAVDAPPQVTAAPHVLGTAVRTVGRGLVIGFLTGFLGVGGGFLVVPVLVVVMRMPIACAVGTSLLLIVLNSGAAPATRAGIADFDWAVLVPFTIAAVGGSVAGTRIADRLSGRGLSAAFAAMLLLVGTFVAVESLVAL